MNATCEKDRNLRAQNLIPGGDMPDKQQIRSELILENSKTLNIARAQRILILFIPLNDHKRQIQQFAKTEKLKNYKRLKGDAKKSYLREQCPLEGAQRRAFCRF